MLRINPLTFNLYLKASHAFIKTKAIPNIILYAFCIMKLNNRKHHYLGLDWKKNKLKGF